MRIVRQLWGLETLLPHTLVIGHLPPPNSALGAPSHSEGFAALGCGRRNGIQIVGAVVHYVV